MTGPERGPRTDEKGGIITDVWEEYERRKREIAREAKTEAEYAAAIRALAEELGL